MAQGSPMRWYAALATLIVFVLLAWLLGAVLTLSEGERVALRVGLVALGLIAAAALLWYLRPQDGALEPEPGDAKDDALQTVGAARARLRSALSSQPLVLVLGTDGSCKTTVVARSGLDPELLAGAAAGDPPPPTTAANLWAVRGAVLAEAGAPVLSDAARWRRFVRALRPAGLRAAVGRGEQASRAVVVCVSCELFYGGDAGEQLDATAQLLRERVGEIAREWGLAVPVYVIFTRADRIPHFEAWAAPLSRDEVRAPLGAALPYDVATGAAAGSYAERLAPRLAQAFEGLGTALAAWRPELLGRESVAERRLDAYEFPRELSKLGPAASRLLVELCRPRQLGVVPMLRGFYFVGARPVVVTDVRATPSVAAAGTAAAPPLVGGGATRAFAQQAALAAATAAPTYAPPTTRRVPQWTFLERLFPEVILGDSGAAVSARGGVRVSRLRRALLGTGIAAALLVAVGITASWLGNRALAARSVDAARAVASLPVVEAAPGTVVFPSPQALRTLDALRGVLDTLQGYEREGPPLRLRWGLWSGASLASAARPAWLGGYARQLHGSAWSALVDSLRALPEAPRPGDDYGRTYGALRAYLVMTTEPARAVPEQLAPVLLASWQRGQPTDADVTALARRQFEWYAGELPRANPFPTASDAAVVRRAREFLGRFAGTEQIYQYMLAEASKAAPPARLAVLAPNAAGVVNAPGDVPGPFTAAGWKFMQDAFRDSDRFFQGERWVMGDATVARAEDRDRVLAELRARYRAEYVQRWRAWVRGLSVARATTVRDAAQRLGTVGGAQSPLLAALSLAARNTVVDSAMRAAFQP
ncbi:MAG: ImcF-related family protein, partial [Gemmatimonadaceae bacterium]